jgi:hypothetical protein
MSCCSDVSSLRTDPKGCKTGSPDRYTGLFFDLVSLQASSGIQPHAKAPRLGLIGAVCERVEQSDWKSESHCDLLPPETMRVHSSTSPLRCHQDGEEGTAGEGRIQRKNEGTGLISTYPRPFLRQLLQ